MVTWEGKGPLTDRRGRGGASDRQERRRGEVHLVPLKSAVTWKNPGLLGIL